MSEYISKEDISRVLLKRIGANKSCLRIAKENRNHEGERYFDELVFEDEQISSLIEGLPPADVRPNIHGHWEPKYPTWEEMIYCQERYFCSNCKGYVVDRIARLEFNFCPNCGADMREPKGEKGTK